MKVLVATKEGQGIRKNDFCWTNEGEFVKFAMECDGESIDGGCGCRRSMAGFDSHKATTTIKVVDMNITPNEYLEKYLQSEKDCGWYNDDNDKEMFVDMGNELLSLANSFRNGILLEKRGNYLSERKVKVSAKV